VGAARRLSTSSLHLADELGFFREAGFELEILHGRPLDSLALLAGGKMDVHLGAFYTAFLNAVIKGLPLRIVAGREIANGACGDVGAIYGMRRTFPQGLAGPAELKQLKGKRVATGTAIGITHFSLDAHLLRAGLSRKDVVEVTLEIRQMIAALVGGGIEACVGADDFDRDLTALDAQIVHSPGLGQIYPNHQYSYIYFGPTMLEAGPDSGARFLSAYLRGVRGFARGQTPRFMEEFARSYRLDLTQARTGCRDSFAVDGAIDLNSLGQFTEWAARRGYIPRRVETSELVDDRFLRKAHAS
jgi:ABC-type nitrate/sulfonate/bicarbonate transport system substrate-binding protein